MIMSDDLAREVIRERITHTTATRRPTHSRTARALRDLADRIDRLPERGHHDWRIRKGVRSPPVGARRVLQHSSGPSPEVEVVRNARAASHAAGSYGRSNAR